MFKRLRYVAGALICTSLSLTAMVFDNRYFPLYQKPFLRRADMRAYFNVQPFLMGASESYGDLPSEGNVGPEENGLFDLGGLYNQAVVNQALQASGRTNSSLLPSDLTLLNSIPWTLQGSLEAYGAATTFYVPINQYCGFGGSWLFMAAKAGLSSTLQVNEVNSAVIGAAAIRSLSTGDIQELYTANKEMYEALGLSCGLWKKHGFGDADLYFRVGKTMEYAYKFRTIDIGANIGVLVPIAEQRNINNPAAMTFGGNRHWGIYGAFDVDLEMKEDIRCGILIRGSKRFKKVEWARMPVLTEPVNFGALVGAALVNPGATYLTSPYVQFSALRDGFGLRVAYTLVYHKPDCWTECKKDNEVQANTCFISARSQWAAEAVTLTALYDFAQDKEVRGRTPTVYFSWDIPVNWSAARRVNKTHSVSLTIETYL